jgi:hypothetical protein
VEKIIQEEEFKDILARVSATFLPRELTLILFLVVVIFLKLIGFLSFFKHLNWIILVVVTYLFSAFVFRLLVKKQTSAIGISNLYLGYDLLAELTFITLIVYLAGGVEWMGVIFFLFPVVYASIVLPRKRALLVCALTGTYYTVLAVLSYFNIIPFYSFWDLEINLYQDPNYVITNILLATATFYSIGIAANLFTDLFKKRTLELGKMRGELEEERSTLEVKVKARTKELENLAKELEGKVKERTRKLEEKMEELEKFNKLAVGRELKMIELKEEVEKLKKERGK